MSMVDPQTEARRQFLRAAGARRAFAHSDECLWRAVGFLSNHFFLGRTADGLFGVAEVWCNHSGVIESKQSDARELVAKGFRVGVLPTAFSTRKVGDRQPYIVVPPLSGVEPNMIYAALAAAGFKGVMADDP
jgi:hypothetical protein